jgi:thioredoxin-related protein
MLFAQNDTIPLYKQFTSIPPFTLLNISDSTIFTKANLLKRKPTLIILFSPDCDHCKQFTSQLIAHIDLLQQYQIIMVSFLNTALIKQFYNEYALSKYNNIIVARDSAYFLGTFYALHTYPSIFLYNKKGKFVQMFDGTVSIKTIAAAL